MPSLLTCVVAGVLALNVDDAGAALAFYGQALERLRHEASKLDALMLESSRGIPCPYSLLSEASDHLQQLLTDVLASTGLDPQLVLAGLNAAQSVARRMAPFSSVDDAVASIGSQVEKIVSILPDMGARLVNRLSPIPVSVTDLKAIVNLIRGGLSADKLSDGVELLQTAAPLLEAINLPPPIASALEISADMALPNIDDITSASSALQYACDVTTPLVRASVQQAMERIAQRTAFDADASVDEAKAALQEAINDVRATVMAALLQLRSAYDGVPLAALSRIAQGADAIETLTGPAIGSIARFGDTAVGIIGTVKDVVGTVADVDLVRSILGSSTLDKINAAVNSIAAAMPSLLKLVAAAPDFQRAAVEQAAVMIAAIKDAADVQAVSVLDALDSLLMALDLSTLGVDESFRDLLSMANEASSRAISLLDGVCSVTLPSITLPALSSGSLPSLSLGSAPSLSLDLPSLASVLGKLQGIAIAFRDVRIAFSSVDPSVSWPQLPALISPLATLSGLFQKIKPIFAVPAWKSGLLNFTSLKGLALRWRGLNSSATTTSRRRGGSFTLSLSLSKLFSAFPSLKVGAASSFTFLSGLLPKLGFDGLSLRLPRVSIGGGGSNGGNSSRPSLQFPSLNLAAVLRILSSDFIGSLGEVSFHLNLTASYVRGAFGTLLYQLCSSGACDLALPSFPAISISGGGGSTNNGTGFSWPSLSGSDINQWIRLQLAPLSLPPGVTLPQRNLSLTYLDIALDIPSFDLSYLLKKLIEPLLEGTDVALQPPSLYLLTSWLERLYAAVNGVDLSTSGITITQLRGWLLGLNNFSITASGGNLTGSSVSVPDLTGWLEGLFNITYRGFSVGGVSYPPIGWGWLSTAVRGITPPRAISLCPAVIVATAPLSKAAQTLDQLLPVLKDLRVIISGLTDVNAVIDPILGQAAQYLDPSILDVLDTVSGVVDTVVGLPFVSSILPFDPDVIATSIKASRDVAVKLSEINSQMLLADVPVKIPDVSGEMKILTSALDDAIAVGLRVSSVLQTAVGLAESCARGTALSDAERISLAGRFSQLLAEVTPILDAANRFQVTYTAASGSSRHSISSLLDAGSAGFDLAMAVAPLASRLGGYALSDVAASAMSAYNAAVDAVSDLVADVAGLVPDDITLVISTLSNAVIPGAGLDAATLETAANGVSTMFSLLSGAKSVSDVLGNGTSLRDILQSDLAKRLMDALSTLISKTGLDLSSFGLNFGVDDVASAVKAVEAIYSGFKAFGGPANLNATLSSRVLPALKGLASKGAVFKLIADFHRNLTISASPYVATDCPAGYTRRPYSGPDPITGGRYNGCGSQGVNDDGIGNVVFAQGWTGACNSHDVCECHATYLLHKVIYY